jgi:hypothetical protein
MIIKLMSGLHMKLERDTRYTAGERFRVTSVEDGFFYGCVERFYAPSHIRRGRMQASPWWRPIPEGAQPQDPVKTRSEALALLHFYHLGHIGGTAWRMDHEN